MRPDQAKDRSIQKYMETSSTYDLFVQFEAPQERGLQIHQTRSHAIVLCNTLPAVCIEKVVCMKTEEEPSQKVPWG